MKNPVAVKAREILKVLREKFQDVHFSVKVTNTHAGEVALFLYRGEAEEGMIQEYVSDFGPGFLYAIVRY